MRRTIVKLLNLGYLAACAVSIWAICTKPVFTTTVKLDMTPEKLGETLQPLLKEENSSSSRGVLRENLEATTKTVTDYITAERIADAFRDPDDPSKSGFHIELPVAVSSKYAFQLKNKQVIQEVVIDNINLVLDNACESLSGPLSRFVFSITQEFAIDALETAINEQIKNAAGEDSLPVTVEEVTEIYNNVYDILSTNEGSVPLSDLTDVIIHGSEENTTSALSILNKFPRYVYDPVSITEEQWQEAPMKYYVKDSSGKYVNTESYVEGAAYFMQAYVEVNDLTAEQYAENPSLYFIDTGSEYVHPESYVEGEIYYIKQTNPYTEEDLDRIDIEGQMQSALEEVPGLVMTNFVSETTVVEKLYNMTLKSTKYFVQSGTSYVPASLGDQLTKKIFIETEPKVYAETTDFADFNDTLESSKYYTLSGHTYSHGKYPFNPETTYHTLTDEIFESTLKSSVYYIADGTVYVQASYNEPEGRKLFTKAEDGTFVEVTTPVSREDFNATLLSNKYYVQNGDSYSLAPYPFSYETEYFIEQASVNDIDSALVALINQYLLKKGEGEVPQRGSSAMRAQPLQNAKSKEELKKALKEFAYKYIPMDKIASISDSYGRYVPWALFALVALVAFPWVLLAFVTLIRTCKTKKVWTTPWIVIVLALPQIIFGFFLTYGTPYAIEIAADKIEIVKKIVDSGLSVELQSLCLVPSFVYLAVVIYSVVYAIFAHDLKVEYKMARRAYMIRRYRQRNGNY